MTVVLVYWNSRWEDCTDFVCVAINEKAAEAHIKYLQTTYPDCYGSQHGKFYFEEHKVVDD